jgi:hypothetical protein
VAPRHTETKQEAAQRLVNTPGSVVRLHERIYSVKGDTVGMRYLTCVPDRESEAFRSVPGTAPGSCTCEAGSHRTVCKHLLAASAVERHVAGGGTWPPES